jgi:non-lysosomal glucosylceramidase
VTRADDGFAVSSVPCGYLEPENVSTPQYAWSHSGQCPFVFLDKSAGAEDSSDAGLVPPALGIRSAVPLGGIGAGSMELRGDGTLQQLTIWNNFPAGAPKFWAFPDALFGLRVGKHTVALRTGECKQTVCR